MLVSSHLLSLVYWHVTDWADVCVTGSDQWMGEYDWFPVCTWRSMSAT